MSGLRACPAATASLLLNLEGVFTALLAWFRVPRELRPAAASGSMSKPAVLGPLFLAAVVALIFLLFRLMVWQARRALPHAARALGLSAAKGGFTGSLDGIEVGVFANHALRYDAIPPTSRPPALPSATGETLILAALPAPLPLPFLLESTIPGGRGHRADRVLTSDPALDAGFSLLTAADSDAATRMIARPNVVSALVELRSKFCCLIEVDQYQVALHTQHHGRTAEMARDAARVARLLSEAGC